MIKTTEKTNQENCEAKEKDEVRDGLKQILKCGAVMYGLLMLDGTAQAAVMAMHGGMPAESASAMLTAATVYMALLAVVYRLARDKSLIVRDGCRLFRESMFHAGLALALQAGMLKFYELATGHVLTSGNQTSLVDSMKHDLFPMVICAVVIAPLMEELIFRLVPSLFFADLWRTAGGCILVTSVTGALFSLSHAPDNAMVFSVYFVTGIVFGHACRRGGYACSSLAHFCYNFASVALALSTVS